MTTIRDKVVPVAARFYDFRARFAASPPDSREGKEFALTAAQAILRRLVLDAVQSPHTRRTYAKALDDQFRFLCQPTSLPGAPDGVAVNDKLGIR
jgi:hypothetical protein